MTDYILEYAQYITVCSVHQWFMARTQGLQLYAQTLIKHVNTFFIHTHIVLTTYCSTKHNGPGSNVKHQQRLNVFRNLNFDWP